MGYLKAVFLVENSIIVFPIVPLASSIKHIGHGEKKVSQKTKTKQNKTENAETNKQTLQGSVLRTYSLESDKTYLKSCF